MVLKLKFYSDPGHGWVAVKKKVLKELGIADKITFYSYMKGQTAYLEEDLDAGLLLNTLKDAGVPYQIIEKNTSRYSPIRNYPQYME